MQVNGRMHARGFTLVEVLVALALLLLAALATAQTLSVGALAVHDSRGHAMAAAAAAQRVEQLLAVEWSDPSLTPSPPATLDQNIDGYCDYLGADGRVISNGPEAPPAATMMRRWAIDVPANGSANARVIRVIARSLAADRAGAYAARGEARLVTVRARLDR